GSVTMGRAVVPSRRLSEFIRSDIDLLKLDVEGAEDAVVDEPADSGKLRHVRRLHLEYQPSHRCKSRQALIDAAFRLRITASGISFEASPSPGRPKPCFRTSRFIPEVSGTRGANSSPRPLRYRRCATCWSRRACRGGRRPRR